MNLLAVPQILTWTAILALQSASASSLRSNCSKKLSVEQLRCFLGEDASFWQDQSHHILSLLTVTKDILVNICEMLWEQLQDKLVCIAGALLTMFLLGYLLHRCCSHADGYRTLMNVQDELGIDELFKVRLGILQGAIFMAIDVTLDNVNGIIYCWRGLKVFGPLTLAIPVVSGFCGFVYKRNSWALAPSDQTDAAGKRTNFYFQNRDRNGQLKPGLKSAILQILQVEAFLTAYAAYKEPEEYEREWQVETAFNGVVEGFPSALLQTYTLFCMEHSNSLPGAFSTFINIVSILFSSYSMGKALNVVSLELLPQTKVEPPPGGLTTTQLKVLQSLDVFARICVLAAIGISLRPAADMTVSSQFYLPPLMLLELLVIWTMSKWYFWVVVILCRRFHPFHCAGIFVTANAGGNWCQFASTASHPTVHDDVASNGTCWWLNPCLVQHPRELAKTTPLRGQFYNCWCLRFLSGCHYHHSRSSLEVFWGAATTSGKFQRLWQNSLGICS